MQGPLSGTYSADSMDGTAPFVAITFTDSSHYQYVAKSCVPQDTSEPGGDDGGAATTTNTPTSGDDDSADSGGGSSVTIGGDDAGSTTTTADAGAGDDAGDDQPISDLGDDPGDQVADNGATPDYNADPTDNGCIHSGTYSVTETTLTLTDDGASKSTTVDMAMLDPDGSEVSDPAATLTTSATQSKTLSTDSLTLGGSLHPDALSGTTGALYGTTSVSAFSAGGTHMRRTGLNNGSGSGSACTIGDGTPGTCLNTSTCSAKSGYMSTPDYCPGPDNIQCCTVSSGSGGGSGSMMGASLVTASAVAAARGWVNAKMPYCQAVQGGRELDSSCFRVHGRTCNRTGAANNANWNHYRSDCSGLVSYAWTLRAPGLTTEGFVPGVAKYIPMQDLQPGDALLRPGHHIVLFESWTNKSSGQAKVLSEPGCDASGGPHAQEQSWSMGRAPGAGTSAHWSGATYYSIRKKGGTLTN